MNVDVSGAPAAIFDLPADVPRPPKAASTIDSTPPTRHSTLLGLVVVGALASAPACGAQGDSLGPAPVQAPAEAEFDSAILRDRGINPRISDYFRHALRFLPGIHAVQVTVNGHPAGRKYALFDQAGRLCFTAELIDAIGLRPMDPGVPIDRQCPDYTVFSPRTVVVLQPAVSAVDITAPQEHTRPPVPTSSVAHGGTGAMFNYRGYATNSRASDGSSPTYRYRYLDTTAGVNLHDWILRSRQDYYSTSGGPGRLVWRAAYLQRTFENHSQIVQAGRITTRDPLFGGVPLAGAQWFPERALQAQHGNFAVQAVASTRATVQIRQNGMLLFQTVVPPGPFSLTDYPLQNRSADLQVQVLEENGSLRNFTVPASSLLLASNNAQAEGWNFAAGRYWDQTQRRVFREDAVGALSREWARGDIAGSLGVLAAPGYRSTGLSAHAAASGAGTKIFGQALFSQRDDDASAGALGSAAASRPLLPDVVGGVSGNLRTAGYRTLQESLAYQQANTGRPYGYRSQWGATLAWDAKALGGISLSLTRENYFYGEPGHVAALNWNRTWPGGISMNVGLSHRTARLSPFDNLDRPADTIRFAGSNYAYLTISVPLGSGATARTFAQRSDGVDRTGTSVEQQINEFLGYRAALDQVDSDAGARRGSSLAAYGNTYYANLSGGVSRVRDYESAYGEIAGSIVMTGDGIAFSPQAVQDSFGTIRTGDVRGARIHTPQGDAWSGLNGVAAVTALPPYQDSRLELSGHSVALDIDVTQGLQVVQASRGAVLQLRMDMKRVQRKMLLVSFADGSPLTPGALILRGDGEYFTASGEGGRVLVTQFAPDDMLQAELADGRRCILGDMKPLPRVVGDLFDRLSATCR